MVYGGSSLRVESYTYLSFPSNVDDSKSNLEYVYTLNGGAICWKDSKQDTTADPTKEAEYIAAIEIAKEGVWMKKFILDVGVVPSNEELILLYYDNNKAIA